MVHCVVIVTLMLHGHNHNSTTILQLTCNNLNNYSAWLQSQACIEQFGHTTSPFLSKLLYLSGGLKEVQITDLVTG